MTAKSKLLNFPAIPDWHQGFITSIALIPKTETKSKDEQVDATVVKSQVTHVPQEGDTVTGVMGGVSFNAIIIVGSAPFPAPFPQSRARVNLTEIVHTAGIDIHNTDMDRPSLLSSIPRHPHISVSTI